LRLDRGAALAGEPASGGTPRRAGIGSPAVARQPWR
jgi:hypothetical protein